MHVSEYFFSIYTSPPSSSNVPLSKLVHALLLFSVTPHASIFLYSDSRPSPSFTWEADVLSGPKLG